MPQLEPSRLQLSARHLEILRNLLAQCVPQAVVWAYGSRVNGMSHEGSDLDLVVRHPTDLSRSVAGVIELRESLQRSSLPMLVEIHEWSQLPESFRRNIESGYVMVSSGAAGHQD